MRPLTDTPTRFGEILLRLRAAWLDGEIANGSQEETLLDKLLAGQPWQGA